MAVKVENKITPKTITGDLSKQFYTGEKSDFTENQSGKRICPSPVKTPIAKCTS